MPMYLVGDLIEELREAHSILEDYHDKCYEELGKTIDPTANETEYCSSFQETYGNEYERLTCYEHDKLRAWDKLLKPECVYSDEHECDFQYSADEQDWLCVAPDADGKD